MTIRNVFLSICLLSLPWTAQAAELGGLMDQAKQMGGDSIVSTLGSQFGLSGDQASGGLGGLLELAKNSLSSENFDRIASAVPGVDGYLEQAQAMGLSSGSIDSLDALKSGLGSIGIDAATVEQFLPAAVDMLGKVGGPEIGQLLKPLLG